MASSNIDLRKSAQDERAISFLRTHKLYWEYVSFPLIGKDDSLLTTVSGLSDVVTRLVRDHTERIRDVWVEAGIDTKTLLLPEALRARPIQVTTADGSLAIAFASYTKLTQGEIRSRESKVAQVRALNEELYGKAYALNAEKQGHQAITGGAGGGGDATASILTSLGL